jgi:di/tricarboxylate transporter
MVTAVVVGGFVSNTAATAFFLPIVFGLARRKGLSPAKFLMPLAFASILASSLTLIGTSTNILVSGFMISYGEEAYGEVNWTVLILIASMLGLGRAMETTGTASFLASQLVNRVGDVHPTWLLSAFFGLTVLLTQPMSNQASAAVVLPVAFNVADQLGLNPRSFGIMIALAASTSFLTPLEPAALLVYGPGHYRFADFPRVGFLLSLLIYLVAILMVPWLWPLR